MTNTKNRALMTIRARHVFHQQYLSGCVQHSRQIFLGITRRADVEVFNQHIQHLGRNELRQSWPQLDYCANLSDKFYQKKGYLQAACWGANWGTTKELLITSTCKLKIFTGFMAERKGFEPSMSD